MSFEVAGTLHKKMDVNKRSETFQVRDFVLEVADGQYPQLIQFQLINDRVGLVDPFEPGSKVKVSFDLRGREWNGKYLTNLNAWRVVAHSEDQNAAQPYAAPSSAAPASASSSAEPMTPPAPPPPAETDDLPF
jgi:hypothetical protein